MNHDKFPVPLKLVVSGQNFTIHEGEGFNFRVYTLLNRTPSHNGFSIPSWMVEDARRARDEGGQLVFFRAYDQTLPSCLLDHPVFSGIKFIGEGFIGSWNGDFVVSGDSRCPINHVEGML